MDVIDNASSLSPAAKYFLATVGVSCATVGLVVLWQLYRCIRAVAASCSKKALQQSSKVSKAKLVAERKQVEAQAAAGPRGPDLKNLIKESQKAATKKSSNKDDQASYHSLFVNTLKGHADTVHSVSWSADGQQLVTACEDMYVRVFDLSDVASKEPKFKRIKTNKIPLGAGLADKADHIATVMRGVPDAIAAMYGPTSAPGASGYEQKWELGNLHGKETPMCMRAIPSSASVGRLGVVVSCSTKKDVRVVSMQGKELAVLEPNSLANHDLAVSVDGRFVAVASFTSEVKIWELKFSKEAPELKAASKAMELKGHKSQVMSVAFAPDNKRAVTVSKDGTLRVWNIDVRYHLSEDPKSTLVIAMPLAEGKCYQHLALSPNGLIAASYEGMVHIINAVSGDLVDTVDAHDSLITDMHWAPKLIKTPAGLKAVLATSSKDKRVRLWRSP